MASKIKTIIIAVVVVAALILAYIFLFKKSPDQTNLSSSTGAPALLPNADTSATQTTSDSEFLAMLLSIRSINLNDSIFKEIAFINLRDSTIVLTPDGTEGRKNPFAPIGSDITEVPTSPDLSVQQ
ncbi:MAG: hypothetical protein WCO07_02265 [bacterium]